MNTNQQLIGRAYAAFNARDLPALLLSLHPQVRWSTAAESDYLVGRAAVQRFLQQQWQQLHTHDEPTSSHEQPDGRVAVLVQQVVRNEQGELISTGSRKHLFTLEDGLLKQLDIEHL